MTYDNTRPAAEQAAVWVTRLYSGDMTLQEERQLRQWRQQERNEDAFQQALATWDLSAQLYRSSAHTDEHHQAHVNPAPEKPRQTWRAFAAASAAVALLSAGLLVTQLTDESNTEIVGTQSQTPESAVPAATEPQQPAIQDNVFRITERLAQLNAEQSRTFSTDVGEVSHIKLDDGSEVSLNTASAVKVTMNRDQRHVELLHGEAYFDVAKDPQRPFVVATTDKEITVLGTEFNVRKRNDEKALRVAVVEGRVAVKKRTPQASLSAEKNTTLAQPEGLGDYDQLLLAGDVAAFSNDSNVIQKNQRDAAKSNTWRRGVVRFDDERLQTVIHELNRYRKRKIAFAHDSLHDLRISGVFHLKNGNAILDALTATLPLQVQRSAEQVTLAPSREK